MNFAEDSDVNALGKGRKVQSLCFRKHIEEITPKSSGTSA
jgi:hypothetical protein